MKSTAIVKFTSAALVLAGSAGAVFSPKTVSTQVTANVADVCVYQGGRNPNADIKTDGNPYSTTFIGTYRANAPLKFSGLAIYQIKCTAGASFTYGTTPGVTLSKAGNAAKLTVLVTQYNRTDSTTTDGADLHVATADLQAAAGQWAVKAGTGYSGTLSTSVDYN